MGVNERAVGFQAPTTCRRDGDDSSVIDKADATGIEAIDHVHVAGNAARTAMAGMYPTDDGSDTDPSSNDNPDGDPGSNSGNDSDYTLVLKDVSGMPRSMSFADVLEGTKWPALQPIFQDNSIDQQQRDSFITSLSRMPTKIRHALEAFDRNGDGQVDLPELTNAAEAYRELRDTKRSYSLDVFPRHLRRRLSVFDVDHDGHVSAYELARACNLYQESKDQRQKLTKCVIVLSVVSFLLLALTLGMMFMVVWALKDTSVHDGQLTTKDRREVVATGTATEAFEVAADASAFELLMSPSVRDQLLRDRPDAVSAALDGGHTVTFPVEFMDASDDTLLMRNLLLGISLTIRKGSTPILQYPRLSSALAPTSMVTHIRIYGKKGTTFVHKISPHQADADLLAPPVTNEEISAERAGASTKHKSTTVLVHDLPAALQKSPLDAADRGDPDAWVLVMQNPQNATALQDLCNLVGSFGGRCGSQEAAIRLGLLSIKIQKDALQLFLRTPDMRTPNKYGVRNAEKSFVASWPAHAVMASSRADPRQMKRHSDVKRLVMSTGRGRHLLGAISRRALSERWYGNALTGRQDCYTADSVYTGEVTTSAGQPCQAWRPGEYGFEPGTTSCQSLTAGRPFCPVTIGGERGMYYCDVPHCVLSMYETSEAPHGISDWNWGLSRIQSDGDAFSLDLDKDRGLLDGSGVHCFVVDSGINVDHSEFRGRIGSQYDAFTGHGFQKDEDGHGSHVAGILAGHTNGVAPGCTLHAVKVLGQNGRSGTKDDGTSTIVQGLYWVIRKWEEVKRGSAAKLGVVNLSVGGQYSPHWEGLVAALNAAGLVVVAAAGNRDLDACSQSPSHVASVLTVGATNFDDTKGVYSNWGSCVKMYAPGTGIRSASHLDNSAFAIKGGTSMAASFVSGALALYIQVHPGATVKEAVHFILDTAVSGQVQGLSEAVFTSHGSGAADWEQYKAQHAGVDDDVQNVQGTPNKLLHLDAALGGHDAFAPRATCPGESGFSEWESSGSCPPRHSVVCGSTSHSVSSARHLNAPLVKLTRTCAAVDCECSRGSALERWESCAPAGTEYTYIAGCGMPAAHLETAADIKWLEGRSLRYMPTSESTFSACSQPNGGRFLVDGSSGMSLSSRLRDDGSIKVTFPTGWKFLFMGKNRHNVWLASNGYLAFHSNTPQPLMNGTLEEQVSRGKREGVSGLFTDLNPEADGCGLDSCGDVMAACTSTGGKRVCAFSWLRVPAAGGAPSDGTNTFQIVLSMDGTGVIDVAYQGVASTSIGRSSIGISPGTGMKDGVFNPKFAPSCPAPLA